MNKHHLLQYAALSASGESAAGKVKNCGLYIRIQQKKV